MPAPHLTRRLFDEDMSTLTSRLVTQLQQLESPDPEVTTALLAARSAVQAAELDALHFMRCDARRTGIEVC